MAAHPAVAAIDCGTNSTRLLVADGEGRTLERLMEITRLGKGVDRTGTLDGEAIERTVAVLRRYRQVMDRHGVTAVRITATSAARDAANRDDFFGPATEAVGAAPELLSGDDEGRTSFAGATADLPEAYRSDDVLVVDIGGGSTELAAGRPGSVPSAVRSLDVGCVRVTERFLHGDPPTSEELAAARAFVDGLLGEAPRELFAPSKLVGLAGTVAALTALEQRLDTYDRSKVHHHVLRRHVVEGLLEELAAMSVAERRRRAGMEQERADVIVGGAVVLAALMARLDVDECLHSEADILDGLVQGLLRT